MTATHLTRLAMVVAGCMLAHQVAAKAVRDAAFLTAWPATALPAVVIATAVLVVAAVPFYSRLLARFGPRTVLPAGFAMSAGAHLLEWQAPPSALLAVLIYLHIAGLGALLLSGFWSLVSELFDPAAARSNYGQVAAAGTLGGLGGGLAAERIAATIAPEAALLFLASAHAACAVGALALGAAGGRGTGAAAAPGETGPLFELDALRSAPHLRVLALIVMFGTAGAAIVDFLFKERAASAFAGGGDLLQFFALFYTAIQVLTFFAQTTVGPLAQRFGLGRTISLLPAGLGLGSVTALLFPVFPLFATVRGAESILRGSVFRAGYELLFVPMDPAEKRRTKTFLDVTCDRAGDALGASIVQLLLLVGPAFLVSELLAAAIAFAVAGLWLGNRLDVLYLRVVERRLVGQLSTAPPMMASETAWSLIEVPALSTESGPTIRTVSRPAGTAAQREAARPRPIDPRLEVLAELRSGDRRRVVQALDGLQRLDGLLVAQVIELLAWDDVVAHARVVLERAVTEHQGQIVDALLDQATDFSVRRRLPRILARLSSQRALDDLVRGLDDQRFEVRYQCSRAIDRMRLANPRLVVDSDRIIAVVDRELSVTAHVWRTHRVLDPDDPDDASAEEVERWTQRGAQHVFALLAAILPREPLTVAFNGLHSKDRALRGVAHEYLDSVLPPHITARLHLILDDEPSS